MERNNFHTVRGYEGLLKNKNLLTSSMEDYLEMIYRIQKEKGLVRVKTLAEMLNVRDSSVTKMVQKLAAINLINYEKYGIIRLTGEGEEIGEYLLNRHMIVEKFLKIITNDEIKLMDVEMIEHNLDPKLLAHLHQLVLFFENNLDVMEKFCQFKGQNK
ncbi:iron (metal) dependent repressor, DtxR family [Anaerobranca californiensis DSM 14826]|jgi:Mn-dependent DtxR family transcriptional regulator|uniref:Manganese transport regulator n=1 Tax=Anaerobranca californiensis DSM 14826 TaxID=1120989 RepID=A0A1M6MV82_9FIRM|nr:iron dependent repressor, metal binding and dimerization domain protein [Anaerobranca californiensis]SHJ87332.1 iron (metal) dependent repressor, DtxR family [Anaerobranca californiensis DSM 14826]